MSFLDELFFTRLASLIKNDSDVVGANVKEALNNLLAGAGGGAVASVFGRAGVVLAALHDYAASLIDNDSDVPGSTVKDALNVLGSAIAALAASNVANDSSVTGAKVKDALNTLLAAIPSVPVSSVFGRTGAVAAAASDYDASQVDNDSSVAGAKVKDALETLAGMVGSSSGSVALSVLPVSAHADDEEFEGSGVPSGWVLQDSPRSFPRAPRTRIRNRAAGQPSSPRTPRGGSRGVRCSSIRRTEGESSPGRSAPSRPTRSSGRGSISR